jgi:hypothetical protein
MPNDTKATLINEETESRILAALRMLHGAVALYCPSSDDKPLPAFDTMQQDNDARRMITGRMHHALTTLQAHREEEEVRHLRQGVKDILEPYVVDFRTAKAAYDTAMQSVPQAMRTYIKPFDPTLEVPLSEFSGVFPAGTDIARQIKALKKMGYTIGKSGESFAVRLTLAFTAGTAKAA